LLIIFILRKRIGLVIQLFKEAGKAMHSMPLLVLQPLWTFLAIIISLVLWTVGMVALESAGDADTTTSSYGFVTYSKTAFLLGMRWVRRVTSRH